MYRTLGAAMVLGLVAGGALAATVDQTISFTDIEDQVLSFARFDTSIGTLTGASIAVSGTATLAAGMITGATSVVPPSNEARFAGFYDGRAQLTGSFGDVEILFGPALSCTTANQGGVCSVRYRGDSEPFFLSGIAGGLTPFIGPGSPVSVSVASPELIFLGVDSGVFLSATSQWLLTGTATLTYTYEPAPDPSVIPLPGGMSLALGGFALLGAVGHRRRKRQRPGRGTRPAS